MTRLIAALLFLPMMLCCAGADAADSSSEVRTIDARATKVVLDGVIDLKLKQGATASLVIYGEPRYLEKVVTTQSGDTLHIDSNLHQHVYHGEAHLRAELTLPALRELVSSGVGSSDVRGFRGAELKLGLEGAGAVTVDGNYRKLAVHLGGVGGMTVNNGDSDSVDLDLRGAGQIVIKGQSRLLRAQLGGIGNLDAEGLRADRVDIEMTGLGSADVYAKTAADLHLSGMGSATVHGNPAQRHVSKSGMGSISWN